jgi:uncharacterized protein YndB with AHSA1/START domain
MPAAPRETSVIEHEIRVAARPETVFAYFTDPARMVQWMGVEATLDPRPGGVCRVNPNGHGVMLGEFVEVDPPRRVAFTWGWEEELFSVPPQSTEVEVSFTPEGADTIVRVVHRRLPSGAAANFHHAGWDHYLARLGAAAAGEDPGPDPWREFEVAYRVVRDAGAGTGRPSDDV